MYIQKDFIFRQRQELYERRHGGSGLQGECKRVEKVNDRPIRNGVTRPVDHSLVQEGLNRNTARSRGRGRGAVLEENKVLEERGDLVECKVQEEVKCLMRVLVLGGILWNIMHYLIIVCSLLFPMFITGI